MTNGTFSVERAIEEYIALRQAAIELVRGRALPAPQKVEYVDVKGQTPIGRGSLVEVYGTRFSDGRQGAAKIVDSDQIGPEKISTFMNYLPAALSQPLVMRMDPALEGVRILPVETWSVHEQPGRFKVRYDQPCCGMNLQELVCDASTPYEVGEILRGMLPQTSSTVAQIHDGEYVIGDGLSPDNILWYPDDTFWFGDVDSARLAQTWTDFLPKETYQELNRNLPWRMNRKFCSSNMLTLAAYPTQTDDIDAFGVMIASLGFGLHSTPGKRRPTYAQERYEFLSDASTNDRAIDLGIPGIDIIAKEAMSGGYSSMRLLSEDLASVCGMPKELN